MTTAEDVYRHCIEFEERAAAIYLQLASRFSADKPELSLLWLDMAMQEKQHAGLLRFCLAEGLFASTLPNAREIRRISGLFERIDKVAADSALDVDGAFCIAAEIEGSEVNEVFCSLTTSVHDSMYLLRRKTVLCPADHVHGLVTAACRFGLTEGTLRTIERLEPCGCAASDHAATPSRDVQQATLLKA